jgi:lysophospholipase L1-like esterase
VLISSRRREALKSFFGAVLLAAIAGCGGGGGGGSVSVGGGDSVTTPAPTPTPTPTPEPPQQPPQSRFYASWTAAMHDATMSLPGTPAPTAQTFDNQTLRQVVRLSLGGDTVRVKLSNLFGKGPVTFSGVHVARTLAATSDIDPTTDRAVTFGGQPTITLQAGAEAQSDAVSLPVTALQNLSISIYFAGPTAVPTVHADGRQTAFIVAGNQLAAPSAQAPQADQRESYFALSSVDVSSTESTRVLVAFGDSLTDGWGSAVNSAQRYPNLLDDRLKAVGQTRTGVVNAGISGNRHALLLMGINDIGFSVEPFPSQPVTAQQLIAAISSAASSARARGIKVLLGTLPPFRPTGYYSDEGEAKRQAVNAWIRSRPDGMEVVDFDAALRDAADPTRLNPAYDSGDHLHPNDAGYKAMAQTVNLTSL